jgi:hypothetical protein
LRSRVLLRSLMSKETIASAVRYRALRKQQPPPAAATKGETVRTMARSTRCGVRSGNQTRKEIDQISLHRETSRNAHEPGERRWIERRRHAPLPGSSTSAAPQTGSAASRQRRRTRGEELERKSAASGERREAMSRLGGSNERNGLSLGRSYCGIDRGRDRARAVGSIGA